jgi:hypothetical protein
VPAPIKKKLLAALGELDAAVKSMPKANLV